jgi:hypothetical protein
MSPGPVVLAQVLDLSEKEPSICGQLRYKYVYSETGTTGSKVFDTSRRE